MLSAGRTFWGLGVGSGKCREKVREKQAARNPEFEGQRGPYTETKTFGDMDVPRCVEDVAVVSCLPVTPWRPFILVWATGPASCPSPDIFFLIARFLFQVSLSYLLPPLSSQRNSHNINENPPSGGV